MPLTHLSIAAALLFAIGYLTLLVPSSHEFPAARVCAAACAGVSVHACADAGAQAEAREDLIAAYIKAMNAGTPEAMRTFEERHRSARALASRDMDDRVNQAMGLQSQWGRLSLRETVRTTPQGKTVLVDTAKAGVFEMEFEFEPGEQGKLSLIRISTVSGLARLDPAAATRSVEALAEALNENYVFPKVGAEMAALLRKNLERGAYGGISTERELADRITTDLQSISADKHLRMQPVPAAQPGAAAPAMRPAPINASFRKVEILEGNVGYIRFDGFASGQDAERVASAAMNFVANCDAVIFDLRHNGGGNPAMVRFITSYLFSEPTHLNSFYDRHGKRTEEFWTLAEVPGKRLRPEASIYVLTSKYTFSGAEEFAYNLQALRRGKVVGEVTGGGAHPVSMVRLGDRFVATIPFIRAHNPITETNWEGVGVRPDIEVEAEQALERALADYRGESAQVMVMFVN